MKYKDLDISLENQAMFCDQQEVLHFFYKNGCVFYFYSSSAKSGGIAHFSQESCCGEKILKFIETVKFKYKMNFKFKVIASQQSIEKLEAVLLPYRDYIESFWSPIDSSIDSPVETYFYTESGRLRTASLKKLIEKKTHSIIKRKKVLIVDDSKTMTTILSKIINSDEELEVVGVVNQPLEVSNFIAKYQPDIMTLDMNMPQKEGLSVVKDVMTSSNPIPIIIVTSINLNDGIKVLEAMQAGAVDYIQKPSLDDYGDFKNSIIEKIKVISQKKLKKHHTVSIDLLKPKFKTSLQPPIKHLKNLLVIGASTGGPEAISRLLSSFKNQIPATVIVQHIPPIFSTAFAQRLNKILPFEVKEAEDGDDLHENRILIAPGDRQLKIEKTPSRSIVRVVDEDPYNGYKPAVDKLFFSVAKNMAEKTAAVILTGMGKDGAEGLLAMRKCGAYTIAQDEESSVVFGMPGSAITIGAADKIAHIDNMASCVENFFYSENYKRAE